jgi:ABC-type multidrug transport system fused ATPase/permease subunit
VIGRSSLCLMCFSNHTSRKHYHAAAGSKRRLMLTLWHLAAPTFIPAGYCQLMTVICQIALPLLVRELLQILEANPSEKVVREGLPYALLIFASSVINAFGTHRHRHLALKSGVVMRAATVNVLYDHVLRLTPRGKTGLTSGEVTNLIAVDTQKLFEVSQEAHLVWSLPLSVLLVTVFLVLIMGPTTLVGVGILCVFVPVLERLTSAIMYIRKARVGLTDERIEITNAMLQGIKVTKLNNYERNYQKKVTEVRDAELRFLRKELALWAMTLVITVSSPLIATAATFATYVFVDVDNILTASKTFSVLLLFSALRFPITYAGRFIGSKYLETQLSVGAASLLTNNASNFTQRLLRRSPQSSVFRSSWREKFANQAHERNRIPGCTERKKL